MLTECMHISHPSGGVWDNSLFNLTRQGKTFPAIAQSLQLRDYQRSLVTEIYGQWRGGNRRVLAQLPTGGGKTIVFGAIAQQFAQLGELVLILAHRDELVTQAADKVGRVAGLSVGIIKAGYPLNLDAPIQVASIQTLINRPELLQRVGLIVVDEAHHSPASTYRTVLGWFPEANLLGVTATPCRLDGSGFEDLYDALVVGPTVGELIQAGHLSPFRLYADPNPMRVKGVRTQQGDYATGELARANNVVELAGNLIGAYRHRCPGKRAIVFAINVEHSRGIASRYQDAGIPAMHLDGETPAGDRRDALARFEAGEIQVLSNCSLFDEGLDIPGIEAVQIARPTKSLVRWLQMVGRALRPAPGKDQAILLDHTRNWAIHGLPTRPRVWTLEGVENVGQHQSRIATDGTVKDEPVVMVINEADGVLEAVKTDPLEEWRAIYYELLETQIKRKYSRGWLYYKLRELKPPLEIWQIYGLHCQYSPGWAWHEFQRQAQQVDGGAA